MSTLRISLPRDTSSPAEARREMRRFAADEDVDDVSMILLVVSELVTNAVVHGSAPIEMCASVDDGTVRIEVSDSDPDISIVVAPPTGSAEIGGRGLAIIGAITRRWGAVPNPAGKVVWAELHRSRRASAPAHPDRD